MWDFLKKCSFYFYPVRVGCQKLRKGLKNHRSVFLPQSAQRMYTKDSKIYISGHFALCALCRLRVPCGKEDRKRKSTIGCP